MKSGGARAQVLRPATPQQTVKRYEIRGASLDPVQGAEMAKSRQLNPAWRTRLGCRVGRRAAEIAVDQIRTLSKTRVGKRLGTLSADEALALRRLITEMYGE